MRLLFWLSLAFVAYVYVGYPMLLAGVARMSRRRPHPVPAPPPHHALPRVSIVIAVRDEAARMAARVENLLGLDYPADRRQIIVVSDGSTDGTVDVLRPYHGEVEVVTLPAGGKPAALNAGVARATGDILVFADARQSFAPDALLHLVSPFADPSVGVVSGELMLDCETSGASDSSIAEGVGLYWQYEKRLRRDESAIGSMLGATGAIYGLRRSLWQPLPPETLLDDVLVPMRAVLSGARAVFEPRARAFDRASADAAAETRRKRRTLAGNYQILWLEPRLLLPLVNPVWWQYVSHKLGRLAVPYALLTLLGASVTLASHGAFYAIAAVGQFMFYGLAVYGARLDARERQARRTRASAATTFERARALPASIGSPRVRRSVRL